MKKLAALVSLLFVFSAHGDELPAFATGSFAPGSFADGSFNSVPQATVPDVIGDPDFTTADAALEAVNLDGLDSPRCYPRRTTPMNGEVIGQSPSAGLMVNEGTIVTVYTSNDEECNLNGPAKPRFGFF